MNKAYFEKLAGYNIWANSLAIGWLNQIRDEQWEKNSVSSFGSVRQTTIHIASAEKIWIDFWKNVSHVINHSTYHRGQLVNVLRQAGFTKFSSVDLATYYLLHRE